MKNCSRAVILSFEGPDAYSTVGGLATRVSEMSAALSRAGVKTTLMFVGDPRKPQREQAANRLEYRRCAQNVSARLQSAVYDGEHEKIAELLAHVPRFIVEEIIAPAARRGEHTLVVMEEWQTASVAVSLDLLLRERNLRSAAALLWNANNTYGFERIDWDALRRAVRITVVSKYMKQILQNMNVESLVIPNGIPDESLAGADERLVRALQTALPGKPLFAKIGRFDPDKRWMQAIDAFALVRREAPSARLIIRGGEEAYGEDILHRAREHDIAVEEVLIASSEPLALVQALGATRAPIVSIRSFVPENLLRALYQVADAILANSGREPFGLVGLEVMATGGIAVCGASGEEYAHPFVNAIVCDTADPRELAVSLRMLADETFTEKIRKAGRETAKRYPWSSVLEILDRKLAYVIGELPCAL